MANLFTMRLPSKGTGNLLQRLADLETGGNRTALVLRLVRQSANMRIYKAMRADVFGQSDEQQWLAGGDDVAAELLKLLEQREMGKDKRVGG